ncbi:hypothetical protein QJS66_11835 [Kocuria rhizophila]|nr:hypothetical protein QJS66_11835 [Kocuria rhizophila]
MDRSTARTVMRLAASDGVHAPRAPPLDQRSTMAVANAVVM